MIKNDFEIERLRTEAQNIILRVGDIIIDHISDMRGILVNRIHHIDIEEDDVYLWEVKLFNRPEKSHNPIMEEDGLKFSIAIGTVEWHSVEQTKSK
jgi:hypothetical protein